MSKKDSVNGYTKNYINCLITISATLYESLINKGFARIYTLHVLYKNKMQIPKNGYFL